MPCRRRKIDKAPARHLQHPAPRTTVVVAFAMSTPMDDINPPPEPRQDPVKVTQRGAPLSITTSSQQVERSRTAQSTPGTFAQPRSSPFQRTVSDPFPPLSHAQRGTPTRASSSGAPLSAGYVDTNLRFLKGDMGDKSPSSRSKNVDKTKRRHSHEPNVNGYTECGRHGNDWLFGGFSVSGTVKKLWEKDRKG